MSVASVLSFTGWLVLAASTAYALLAILAQWLWARQEPPSIDGAALPAVSVLKPLCGAEPRLYENLRSFCQQSHPRFQLLFGTRSADDPALEVVRRLQTEFPQLDIAVVSDPRIHGRNLKVSNLLNLLPQAKHDWLVIADSDISVDPLYLARVTAPLRRADVGLVTCLYRGHALGSAWARLGKQFIDDWFAPAVLVTRLFGSNNFGFGATLALRRDTLDAIGGLEVLATDLADDHALGALTRARGLRTVLSANEVATDVTEHALSELAAHELRWLRTIRMIQPVGYSFTFVTFTVPVALAGWLLTGAASGATLLLGLALGARLILHYQSIEPRYSLRDLPNFCADLALFGLRDTLSLGFWAAAFFGQRVSWRGQQLALARPTPDTTSLNSDSCEACK